MTRYRIPKHKYRKSGKCGRCNIFSNDLILTIRNLKFKHYPEQHLKFWLCKDCRYLTLNKWWMESKYAKA